MGVSKSSTLIESCPVPGDEIWLSNHASPSPADKSCMERFPVLIKSCNGYLCRYNRVMGSFFGPPRRPPVVQGHLRLWVWRSRIERYCLGCQRSHEQHSASHPGRGWISGRGSPTYLFDVPRMQVADLIICRGMSNVSSS